MSALTRPMMLAALLVATPAAAQETPSDHAHMHHAAPEPAPPPSGSIAPPPAPADYAADAIWGADVMAASRVDLHRMHGAMPMNMVLLDLFEAQPHEGRTGYRWDAEGWWGGDVNRLVVKTEGEGRFGKSVESAEVQALYGHAIGPYFDLQAGIRQDLGAGPKRTYAAVAVEGLAPYWFETEATLFLSDKGDLSGRIKATYDQRITQRLILQPRAEFNLTAQDVPGARLGRGLSSAEAGLRLRYELRREFAPYVGVSWERKLGRTARYARADGEDPGQISVVLGIRTWF